MDQILLANYQRQQELNNLYNKTLDDTYEGIRNSEDWKALYDSLKELDNVGSNAGRILSFAVEKNGKELFGVDRDWVENNPVKAVRAGAVYNIAYYVAEQMKQATEKGMDQGQAYNQAMQVRNSFIDGLINPETRAATLTKLATPGASGALTMRITDQAIKTPLLDGVDIGSSTGLIAFNIAKPTLIGKLIFKVAEEIAPESVDVGAMSEVMLLQSSLEEKDQMVSDTANKVSTAVGMGASLLEMAGVGTLSAMAGAGNLGVAGYAIVNNAVGDTFDNSGLAEKYIIGNKDQQAQFKKFLASRVFDIATTALGYGITGVQTQKFIETSTFKSLLNKELTGNEAFKLAIMPIVNMMSDVSMDMVLDYSIHNSAQSLYGTDDLFTMSQNNMLSLKDKIEPSMFIQDFIYRAGMRFGGAMVNRTQSKLFSHTTGETPVEFNREYWANQMKGTTTLDNMSKIIASISYRYLPNNLDNIARFYDNKQLFEKNFWSMLRDGDIDAEAYTQMFIAQEYTANRVFSLFVDSANKINPGAISIIKMGLPSTNPLVNIFNSFDNLLGYKIKTQEGMDKFHGMFNESIIKRAAYKLLDKGYNLTNTVRTNTGLVRPELALKLESLQADYLTDAKIDQAKKDAIMGISATAAPGTLPKFKLFGFSDLKNEMQTSARDYAQLAYHYVDAGEPKNDQKKLQNLLEINYDKHFGSLASTVRESLANEVESLSSRKERTGTAAPTLENEAIEDFITKMDALAKLNKDDINHQRDLLKGNELFNSSLDNIERFISDVENNIVFKNTNFKYHKLFAEKINGDSLFDISRQLAKALKKSTVPASTIVDLNKQVIRAAEMLDTYYVKRMRDLASDPNMSDQSRKMEFDALYNNHVLLLSSLGARMNMETLNANRSIFNSIDQQILKNISDTSYDTDGAFSIVSMITTRKSLVSPILMSERETGIAYTAEDYAKMDLGFKEIAVMQRKINAYQDIEVVRDNELEIIKNGEKIQHYSTENDSQPELGKKLINELDEVRAESQFDPEFVANNTNNLKLFVLNKFFGMAWSEVHNNLPTPTNKINAKSIEDEVNKLLDSHFGTGKLQVTVTADGDKYKMNIINDTLSANDLFAYGSIALRNRIDLHKKRMMDSTGTSDSLANLIFLGKDINRNNYYKFDKTVGLIDIMNEFSKTNFDFRQNVLNMMAITDSYQDLLTNVKQMMRMANSRLYSQLEQTEQSSKYPFAKDQINSLAMHIIRSSANLTGVERAITVDGKAITMVDKTTNIRTVVARIVQRKELSKHIEVVSISSRDNYEEATKGLLEKAGYRMIGLAGASDTQVWVKFNLPDNASDKEKIRAIHELMTKYYQTKIDRWGTNSEAYTESKEIVDALNGIKESITNENDNVKALKKIWNKILDTKDDQLKKEQEDVTLKEEYFRKNPNGLITATRTIKTYAEYIKGKVKENSERLEAANIDIKSLINLIEKFYKLSFDENSIETLKTFIEVNKDLKELDTLVSLIKEETLRRNFFDVNEINGIIEPDKGTTAIAELIHIYNKGIDIGNARKMVENHGQMDNLINELIKVVYTDEITLVKASPEIQKRIGSSGNDIIMRDEIVRKVTPELKNKNGKHYIYINDSKKDRYTGSRESDGTVSIPPWLHRIMSMYMGNSDSSRLFKLSSRIYGSMLKMSVQFSNRIADTVEDAALANELRNAIILDNSLFKHVSMPFMKMLLKGKKKQISAANSNIVRVEVSEEDMINIVKSFTLHAEIKNEKTNSIANRQTPIDPYAMYTQSMYMLNDVPQDFDKNFDDIENIDHGIKMVLSNARRLGELPTSYAQIYWHNSGEPNKGEYNLSSANDFQQTNITISGEQFKSKVLGGVKVSINQLYTRCLSLAGSDLVIKDKDGVKKFISDLANTKVSYTVMSGRTKITKTGYLSEAISDHGSINVKDLKTVSDKMLDFLHEYKAIAMDEVNGKKVYYGQFARSAYQTTGHTQPMLIEGISNADHHMGLSFNRATTVMNQADFDGDAVVWFNIHEKYLRQSYETLMPIEKDVSLTDLIGYHHQEALITKMNSKALKGAIKQTDEPISWGTNSDAVILGASWVKATMITNMTINAMRGFELNVGEEIDRALNASEEFKKNVSPNNDVTGKFKSKVTKQRFYPDGFKNQLVFFDADDKTGFFSKRAHGGVNVEPIIAIPETDFKIAITVPSENGVSVIIGRDNHESIGDELIGVFNYWYPPLKEGEDRNTYADNANHIINLINIYAKEVFGKQLSKMGSGNNNVDIMESLNKINFISEISMMHKNLPANQLGINPKAIDQLKDAMDGNDVIETMAAINLVMSKTYGLSVTQDYGVGSKGQMFTTPSTDNELFNYITVDNQKEKNIVYIKSLLGKTDLHESVGLVKDHQLRMAIASNLDISRIHVSGGSISFNLRTYENTMSDIQKESGYFRGNEETLRNNFGKFTSDIIENLMQSYAVQSKLHAIEDYDNLIAGNPKVYTTKNEETGEVTKRFKTIQEYHDDFNHLRDNKHLLTIEINNLFKLIENHINGVDKTEPKEAGMFLDNEAYTEYMRDCFRPFGMIVASDQNKVYHKALVAMNRINKMLLEYGDHEPLQTLTKLESQLEQPVFLANNGVKNNIENKNQLINAITEDWHKSGSLTGTLIPTNKVKHYLDLMGIDVSEKATAGVSSTYTDNVSSNKDYRQIKDRTKNLKKNGNTEFQYMRSLVTTDGEELSLEKFINKARTTVAGLQSSDEKIIFKKFFTSVVNLLAPSTGQYANLAARGLSKSVINIIKKKEQYEKGLPVFKLTKDDVISLAGKFDGGFDMIIETQSLFFKSAREEVNIKHDSEAFCLIN